MKKKKPIARKVVASLPPGIFHRVGVTSCPHCDYNDMDYTSWHKGAVMLVTEIVQGKHGSMAVISECAKCFEKSWVHETFSSFRCYDEYDEEWKAVAEKVENARHLAALLEFCGSLCVSCIHLRGFEGDTLCWKTCTMGRDDKAALPAGRKFYYDKGPAQQTCDKYQKRV